MRLLILLVALLSVQCSKKPAPIINSNAMIRIAIIDTGWDQTLSPYHLKLCPTGHFDYNTNLPLVGSNSNHGTMVGSIIAKELREVDYCAIIIQVKVPGGIPDEVAGAALQRAADEHADYVNYALYSSRAAWREIGSIIALNNMGSKVFVSAGNDAVDLTKTCNSYPSCYNLPNVYSVGALQGNDKAKYSNYGTIVSLWEQGNSLDNRAHGTSFAVPRALSAEVLRYWRVTRKQTTQVGQ